MILIKYVLMAGLVFAGLSIIMSLLKEKRRASQQTPITLVTLADELWLKNSGRCATDREKKREDAGYSPLAKDFKARKKPEGDEGPKEDGLERGALPRGGADLGNGCAGREDEPKGGGGADASDAAGGALSQSRHHGSAGASWGRNFRKEFMEPHDFYLTEQKADGVIDTLLEILSEHEAMSSIIMNRSDVEFLELAEVAHMLTEVKLITHTETVTRIMVDMCKDTFAEWGKMMPVALVAAVGHDIGKTRGGNHPEVSSAMLSEIIPDDRAWKRRVIHAVSVHHAETDDQLSTMLKAADLKARGYELAAAMPEGDVRPFEQWFDTGVFLKKYIEPEVNITQMHSCNAMSLDGVVYVKAEFMYDAAYRMSQDAKVMDVRFFCPSEKDGIVRHIVKALRDGGYVHDSLKPDTFSIRYEMGFDKPAMKKLTMQLIPLKGESFDIEAAEARKTDFLVDLKDLKERFSGKGKNR